MIDWTVSEPRMFPTHLPSKRDLEAMEQARRALEPAESVINGGEGNSASPAGNSGWMDISIGDNNGWGHSGWANSGWLNNGWGPNSQWSQPSGS
jgi:hypothetical protein